MHPHPERPGRRDLGVFLAQGAGGRVPRVGERPPAPLGQLKVQGLEGLERQVHLAADLEHTRRIVGEQPRRDTADGTDVGGDVLADPAVAAGRGLHEPPGLVGERAGHAVDLELAREPGAVADLLLDPPAPRVELLERERVVEREHRGTVRDRREELGRHPTDPLGG